MLEEVRFVTWEMIGDPKILVVLLLFFVQATKGGFDRVIAWINDKTPTNWNVYVPTKFYAWLASFVMLIVNDLHKTSVGDAEFTKWNLVLHVFTALVFVVGTGAMHDYLQESKDK